jgi:ribose transport system permease protein
MVAQNTQGTPCETLSAFTKLKFYSLSSITVLCVVIAALFAVLMYKTKYGKRIHAIGQSRRAAELSGINVKKLLIIAFVLSSLLGGIVGILLCGYNDGAFLDLGNSYSLTMIAATLLGGTIVSGGKSSVAGTLAGGLMLMLIVTFITLTRLSIGFQYLIEGAILIIILTVSTKKEESE